MPKSKKLLKFTLDDGSGKERTILSGIKENYYAEELIGKTLLAICNLPPRKMMGIDSEGMIISAIHDEEGEEALNLLVLNPRIPAGAKNVLNKKPPNGGFLYAHIVSQCFDYIDFLNFFHRVKHGDGYKNQCEH